MQPRLRTLCIVLLILVLAGFGGLYVFWSLIRQGITKIHTVNIAVEEQALHHDENESLKALLADVGPDIESLKTRIIGSDDTVSFIDNIETMARQTGATITVDAVSEKPAVEGKDYEYISLTMSTEGSWNHVHTFVSMIESLPYKVTINSLTLDQQAFEEEKANASSTKQVQRSWRGTIIIDVLKKK